MSNQDNKEQQSSEIYSSISDVEQFRNSPVFIDMQNLLTDRIKLLHISLEGERDINRIIEYQSVIAHCRDMLRFTDDIIEDIQQLKEDKEQE